MAPSSPPTPSARRASTSPTTAPGAIIPWSSRWPTPASRSTWSIAAATARRTSRPTSTIDKAIAFCRRAGFRRIYLRGDTDFSQTAHLDRWDASRAVRFLFGIDANEALVAMAEALPADAYSFLERPPKYAIKTAPRQRPERVKAEIVRRRGFETIHTLEEMVAEFDYRPTACRRDLSRGGAPQAAGDRQGIGAAARGVSLLLLHHQRPRDRRPTRWSSRRTVAATRRT